jgi:hypothetical protein
MDFGGFMRNQIHNVAKERALHLRKASMEIMGSHPEDIHIEDVKIFKKIESDGLPYDGLGKLIYDYHEIHHIEN